MVDCVNLSVVGKGAWRTTTHTHKNTLRKKDETLLFREGFTKRHSWKSELGMTYG